MHFFPSFYAEQSIGKWIVFGSQVCRNRWMKASKQFSVGSPKDSAHINKKPIYEGKKFSLPTALFLAWLIQIHVPDVAYSRRAIHLIKEYTSITWKLDTPSAAAGARMGLWRTQRTKTHFVILPCFFPSVLVIRRNCSGGRRQVGSCPPPRSVLFFLSFEKAMTINSNELIAKSQFKIPTPYTTPDRTSLKVHNG